MAVNLGTGVPWVMCKQDDAPDPIVTASLRAFLSFSFTVAFVFLYLSFTDDSFLGEVYMVRSHRVDIKMCLNDHKVQL